MHSPDSTKPHFRYNGLPASVESRLISVAPFFHASSISILTIFLIKPDIVFASCAGKEFITLAGEAFLDGGKKT